MGFSAFRLVVPEATRSEFTQSDNRTVRVPRPGSLVRREDLDEEALDAPRTFESLWKPI